MSTSMITLFLATFRRAVQQPAIILLFIIELAVILIILLGLTCEHDGDLLVSLTLFGNTMEAEDLLIFRIMLNNISQVLWIIINFLLILGTASLFADFLSDALIPILLTKRISRTQLVIYYYVSIMGSIVTIQTIFAGLLTSALYYKTGEHLWSLAYPVIGGPLMHVLILVALSGPIALVFEKASTSIAVILIVYFLQPFLYSSYHQTSTLIKIGILLFPPVAQVNDYFQSFILSSQHPSFPLISFIYAAIFLCVTIFLFQRKDVSLS